MSSLEVSVIDSREGFDRLRAAWDECLERSATASIFVTGDWMYHWWVHYGAGRSLRLFVARRGDRVVGLLPLYVRRERTLGTLHSRVLRFVGTGDDTSPDYLGPIVEAEGEKNTLSSLCRAVMADRSWDTLNLSDLRAESTFAHALQEAGREAGTPARRYCGGAIRVARLPSTWDGYLKRLRRNQRHNVRRARTRLEEEHGGRFFRWEDGSTLDRAIDRLAELHRLRWNGRAAECSFSSDRYLGFHREVMHACHSRGRLRLNCLAFDGRLAAVNYAYAYRGEVSLFQTGFDPERGALRPGYALLAWSIEQAISEGMRVFDFLKGEHSYKKTWAQDRRSMCVIRANRRTAAGRLEALRREHLPRLRGRLKPVFA